MRGKENGGSEYKCFFLKVWVRKSTEILGGDTGSKLGGFFSLRKVGTQPEGEATRKYVKEGRQRRDDG